MGEAGPGVLVEQRPGTALHVAWQACVPAMGRMGLSGGWTSLGGVQLRNANLGGG